MNSNIEDLIESKIDNIVKENNIYHKGKVVRINSFVVEATGLDDAFFFEKVYIGDEDNIGYVDKISENKVYIALVKTNGKIRIGDSIKTTGEALQASFSKNAMGMIVDAFGMDRMSGKHFNESKMIPIETEKIPIMDRTAVCRPLETGISCIDLMFPIGRGQRQLIIGDKKTGKTQILLDTIVNQKGKDVICIYISIGKTKKEIKRLYTKLVEKGANSYTQIVAAFNDDTSPLIKLTPYVGVSIAEEYMKEGKDVLVCIDDLKKHADACREIALIAEKNTGREAYPADIFYTHSRLLEKGCQHKNGGSITILPVVETKGGDITDYISTNIISITDGQIVLSEKNFKKGQKPALNFGLSVSRLGGAVQKASVKTVGATVRRELLSYLETADVYQLVNIESMTPDLQEKIYRGKKMLELLKQPKFSPRSGEKMVEAFTAVLSDSIQTLESKDIKFETEEQNNDKPQTPKKPTTKTKKKKEETPVEVETPKDDSILKEKKSVLDAAPMIVFDSGNGTEDLPQIEEFNKVIEENKKNEKSVSETISKVEEPAKVVEETQIAEEKTTTVDEPTKIVEETPIVEEKTVEEEQIELPVVEEKEENSTPMELPAIEAQAEVVEENTPLKETEEDLEKTRIGFPIIDYKVEVQEEVIPEVVETTTVVEETPVKEENIKIELPEIPEPIKEKSPVKPNIAPKKNIGSKVVEEEFLLDMDSNNSNGVM